MFPEDSCRAERWEWCEADRCDADSLTTVLGRLVERDLGWMEGVLLLDLDLLLVATVGVRLLDRARLLDLVLDVVLVLVRLEDLPLPFGAGDG